MPESPPSVAPQQKRSSLQIQAVPGMHSHPSAPGQGLVLVAAGTEAGADRTGIGREDAAARQSRIAGAIDTGGAGTPLVGAATGILAGAVAADFTGRAADEPGIARVHHAADAVASLGAAGADVLTGAGGGATGKPGVANAIGAGASLAGAVGRSSGSCGGRDIVRGNRQVLVGWLVGFAAHAGTGGFGGQADPGVALHVRSGAADQQIGTAGIVLILQIAGAAGGQEERVKTFPSVCS